MTNLSNLVPKEDRIKMRGNRKTASILVNHVHEMRVENTGT